MRTAMRIKVALSHSLARRFVASPLVLGSLAFITLLLVMAIRPALFSRQDPYTLNPLERLRPPSFTHLLGTDENGRDLWTRIVYGTRVTLSSALLLIVLAASFGTFLGMLIGYAGEKTDEAMMRVTELFLAFPQLVWALAITAVIGRSLLNCVLALSLTWWAQYARLMRAQVLICKEREFIQAARALGQSAGRIMLYHLLPNCIAPVLVKTTLDLSLAILFLAALSFLGVGAQPPTPEWGAMVTTGRKYLLSYWWYPTFPGLAIFLTVLAFNAVSERIRDMLDPTSRS